MVSSACLIFQLTKQLSEPRSSVTTLCLETSSAAHGIALISGLLPLPKSIFGSFAVPFPFRHSQPLERFEQAPAEMSSPKNKAECQIPALGSINHQVGNCRK